MWYKHIAVVKPGLIGTYFPTFGHASKLCYWRCNTVFPFRLSSPPTPSPPLLPTLIGFAIIITCNFAVLNMVFFPNLTHNSPVVSHNSPRQLLATRLASFGSNSGYKFTTSVCLWRSSGPSQTDDRARPGKNGRGADWLWRWPAWAGWARESPCRYPSSLPRVDRNRAPVFPGLSPTPARVPELGRLSPFSL
jgi:hypothetical protein